MKGKWHNPGNQKSKRRQPPRRPVVEAAPAETEAPADRVESDATDKTEEQPPVEQAETAPVAAGPEPGTETAETAPAEPGSGPVETEVEDAPAADQTQTAEPSPPVEPEPVPGPAAPTGGDHVGPEPAGAPVVAPVADLPDNIRKTNGQPFPSVRAAQAAKRNRQLDDYDVAQSAEGGYELRRRPKPEQIGTNTRNLPLFEDERGRAVLCRAGYPHHRNRRDHSGRRHLDQPGCAGAEIS